MKGCVGRESVRKSARSLAECQCLLLHKFFDLYPYIPHIKAPPKRLQLVRIVQHSLKHIDFVLLLDVEMGEFKMKRLWTKIKT